MPSHPIINKSFTKQRPDKVSYLYRTKKGLNERIVKEISHIKNEPDWMRNVRLRAYQTFKKKPILSWGADLSALDLDDIYYYMKPTDKVGRKWSEVPQNIRKTYDRLGIPAAEKKWLGGVMAQYESEAVYHSIKNKMSNLGVIFEDMDTALKKYPDIIKKYFSTVVPAGDNKFSALNTAVWSGGSFLYVPEGVHVQFPLQSYFRINAEKVGQFERTLIIAEPGSFVHYIEGCTAPIYSTSSLHAAVVEIIVKPGARVRYTTVQNWSKNVFNLVSKRAFVYEEGIMEWVDGNLGSQVTMKYPSIYLLGRKAKGDVLSIAMANNGQHQDVGSKAIHGAPETSSSIISKSVSKGSGRTSYRGLVKVPKCMKGCKSSVVCDALLLSRNSRSDTYPTMDIEEADTQISHEASVGRVGEEQLFYLMSRGLSEQEAVSMIVSGFIEPIAKELPMEFAVELNRLIELEMEGSVG
ncbi:Fe-S cluster assembly protein SufB [Patescibacteria group bacterium]|nr:Fe-S cluster assembly protein SufB [Patescibacteria group bacterium]MBU0964425.1 Fe-S cluster assembly protein SufB [Patescibacteria group bacterium]